MRNIEKVLNQFRDALLLSRVLFPNNKAVWDQWTTYYTDVEANHGKLATSSHFSPSFSAFVSWLELKNEQGISLLQIYTNIEKYKEEIHNSSVGVMIANEFETKETRNNLEQIAHKTIVEEDTITKDYFEVNNSAIYFHLRDGIAKNQFEEDEATNLKMYAIEAKNTNGVAQLSAHKDEDLRLTNNDEAARWTTLINGVMSNMDDLTADCLDSITIQWLKQAKSPDEFIDFSYRQVLDMCNIPKAYANGIEYFRAEDKIKIAKRIAALASIFIYLNDNNEVVVLNEQTETGKQYEMKREVIKRLFVLDSVVLWRDKNTNEYMGIESCRIKPGSFLSRYLFGSNSTTALLSKKALEYNSYRHKYHKRLIRYLSWQWRIRQQYDNLRRPYSIGGDKGLLAVMGVKIGNRPNRVRELLENVLMDLEKEKVISHWSYSEEIDENQVKKRNWFDNYYAKLGIIILPLEELMQNSTQVLLEQTKETGSLQKNSYAITEANNNKNIEETIRNQIIYEYTKKNVTMRELANEIGLSPATLSRFYNQKMKRMSNQIKEKLIKWYERQQIIKSME
ncbi:helix-turn-helix transcriptional regulator [Bacillus manliponensis]